MDAGPGSPKTRPPSPAQDVIELHNPNESKHEGEDHQTKENQVDVDVLLEQMQAHKRDGQGNDSLEDVDVTLNERETRFALSLTSTSSDHAQLGRRQFYSDVSAQLRTPSSSTLSQ